MALAVVPPGTHLFNATRLRSLGALIEKVHIGHSLQHGDLPLYKAHCQRHCHQCTQSPQVSLSHLSLFTPQALIHHPAGPHHLHLHLEF